MRAIGIDIGTTTISAVIVDMETKANQLSYTIDNGSFLKSEHEWEKMQDPEVIIEKSKKLVNEIFETYDDIAVIGLTGQMHGIVYLDQTGHHVSPLYTWQDGRGNDACFDGKSVCDLLRETGEKAHTGYGLVTHYYNMKKGLVPENAVCICTIMDYLGMVLTGRKAPLIHISNAASFGMYNVEKSSFKKDILQKIGVDESILPEITEEFELLGTYKTVPVCVAFGDNQASFMGSVKDAAGSILVNMGTGGQISVLSDTYFTTEGIEARPFVKNEYLLVGSSLCGGRAYAALEKFFHQYADAMNVEGVDHYAVMGRLLEDRNTDLEKLKVTTSFSGTRENPEKRGKITNIGIDNFNPATLIYGVLEGMADELYEMYAGIVQGTQMKKTKMIASGNGFRRNHYLQDIMSEKFAMTLQMAEQNEEAAYGSTIAGMIAVGVTSLKEMMGI